ncbi:MAG: YesL family protein [Eubacterium sp.]|nr:YesL family protein [Eubacterium sp.]
MNNLFNPDNKFFAFMGKVADLMILNLLCIVCCLPIITAGASITALYYVTLKIARNEETYIARGFFHSFKENFKQATIIHLIMIVLGALLIFDLYFVRVLQPKSGVYKAASYMFMAALVVYAMVLTYIYPVLAKFYNTIRHTFQNAVLMSIRHLPYTLLMFAVTIAPVALMFLIETFSSYIILFYMLMGFAVVALLNSYLFVKIFDRYIPAEDDSEESNEPKEIDASVFKNLQPVEILEEDEDGKAEFPDNETSDTGAN